MNITTLAAWGEFIGGIAVVVSLVYLAGQIRQNSKLVRASTTAADANSATAFSLAISQDAEMARIYWDGMADRDGLSEPDRRRFDPLVGVQFANVNQQYEFIRDGTGSPRVWERQLNGLRWQLQQHGIQQWWREWGGISHEGEFRDYVDGLIREGEAAG
jgi:hypothetical protein